MATRLLPILVLGALGVAPAARADQQAWIPLEVGRRATAAIERSGFLVSYCSLCSDAVEVWRVKSATVAPTPSNGYYQVKISGRRMFRSKTKFDEGAYREPVEYQAVDEELWDEGIDLAYAYVGDGAGRRFTPLCRLLRLECDVRTEAITLPPQLLPEVIPVMPPLPGVQAIPEQAPWPVQPLRIGGSIKEPKKTQDAKPVYPDIAKQAQVQGVVILQVTIGVDGQVVDAKVIRGIPLLDQAALDAVKQWRYEPTLLNGQPVPVVMTVTVSFRLQ